LAWAYHKDGHREEALEAIEQAIVLDPDAVRNHLRAGQIYEAAGQTERALAAYRQLLDLRPDNKTALEAIARLSDE
jgi:predicted TPR repeat methyltransferase